MEEREEIENRTLPPLGAFDFCADSSVILLMSIVTKTGDSGTTALMYGRRVPKNHPRVETYGMVDELNAVLGLARATATEHFVSDNLFEIQKDLVVLMGELCVQPEDLPRYVKDGWSVVTPDMTARLDALVKAIESQNAGPKGWAMPGANLNAAALDMARTVCRRAERRVCALKKSRTKVNPEIIVYLNRLSDLLWLFARWVEAKNGTAGK
jgi:cob(I)alamin adenosyltransferase